MSISHEDKIAMWRHTLVGTLLASPPHHGELAPRLRELSEMEWKHPIDGRPVTVSVSTLARWYYASRDSANAIAALRPQRRSDAGVSRSMRKALCDALRAQYRLHPEWSARHHYRKGAAQIGFSC